jgi:WD40 repeat protein
VWKAAFSPDGALLATCTGEYGAPDDPGELKIWDLKTHTERASLAGHEGIIYDATFSPDGKTLYSASHDATIKMWDVAEAKEKSTLKGHKAAVRALKFTPDGKTLASASFDGTVRFWDPATGELKKTFELHAGGVQCVVFAADGQYMATTARPPGMASPAEVFVWDVESGKEIGRFARSRGPILSIAFSADGRMLATGGGWLTSFSELRVLELASGQPRAVLEGHREWIEHVGFSPDGKSLVSAGGLTLTRPGEVRVWQLAEIAGKLDDEEPEADKPEELWKALAGEDAPAAYRAILRLVASPEVAVPLLAEHVEPVTPADAKRIARLIADLDADEFAVREKASQELDKLGDLATEALEEALKDPPSEEVRLRATLILRSSPLSPVGGEELRTVRTIEVLESIGTPEARQILAKLAQGEPRARVTRDAASALERLGR